MKKIEKLSDLIPDENNYNKGTEFGGGLIEKSFRKLGAGRSVLADKNGKLIAGNKAHEGVMNAGFSDDDIIVVKTDGTKLVVVQRTDLDLNTRKGKEMALADNATSKANLDWSYENMRADEWSKDELNAWGVSDWQEIEEEPEDLIGENKDKPPTLKITFPTPEDLQKCESEIQEVINRLCPKAFYSVSAGEI